MQPLTKPIRKISAAVPLLARRGGTPFSQCGQPAMNTTTSECSMANASKCDRKTTVSNFLDGPTRRRSSRRGSLTLEAVLVLPILLLATLAVVQFGVLMLIEQTITHAVTVAAREAGKGADIDATVLSVNAVLGLHGLSVGPGATLVLEDSLSTPAVQVRGTLPCSVPSTPSVPAGMLKATLCVDLTQKTVL
ncbi:MAG: hypothetical protein KatS3mg112_1478 [Thermogutta sp.]|nr:MAG: hypothetical protein KatS3mg112_1478 [Thermogutta sp.]